MQSPFSVYTHNTLDFSFCQGVILSEKHSYFASENWGLTKKIKCDTVNGVRQKFPKIHLKSAGKMFSPKHFTTKLNSEQPGNMAAIGRQSSRECSLLPVFSPRERVK